MSKIAKVFIRGEVRYVSSLWFAEDDVIGECLTTNWKDAAAAISERDAPYVVAFYKNYGIVVNFEDEE